MSPLIHAIENPAPAPRNGTGLTRIANLDLETLSDGPDLEDTTDHNLKLMDPPDIATLE